MSPPPPENAEPETYQIMRTIEHSIVAEDDIDLEQYLLFWKHVCRLMGSWSTIFGFVVKDVSSKMEKIKKMKESDEEAYRTMLTMARKEADDGTIRNQKPNRSGTGHLLVLNRALEFVISMLDGVFGAEDPEAKVSVIARGAYDKHLSPFHNWVIRTAAGTALFTLPRKKEFLIRLRGEMPETDDEKFHDVFQRDGQEIVRRVQKLVEQYELQDYNPSA